MKKIAITGGIGSGKTFVSELFKCIGIPVYSADSNAKRLMLVDKQLKKGIKNLLGDESYYKNGRPNRDYIAHKIFNKKSLLKKMNALIHPAVRNHFELWASNQDAPYVLEESAIVYEAGLESYFDAVILIIADEKLRIERVKKRDALDEKSIKERITNQISDRIKSKRADFIILNDGSISLIKQVNEVHNKILNLRN